MYFIPRGNKYYVVLAQMKPWKRWLFAFLIPLSIVIFWLTFIYFRLESSTDTYRLQKKNIENQLDLLHKSEGEVERLKKVIKDLRLKFREYDMPSAGNNFNVIIKQAKVAGVALNSCTDDGICKKEWYAQKNIAIDVRGTMDQIKAFFKKINASHQLCGCSQFVLTNVDEGIFQARCTLSCYQLAKQKK